MPRRQVGIAPSTTAALRREVVHTRDWANRNLSFGSDRSGDGVPEPDNMLGTWVKASFTTPGGTATFSHNLNVQATSAVTPNVVWEIICFKHSGAGAPAAGLHGGALSLVYEGGAVTANSIVLVLRTSGARTIDAPNPVTALVFFAPVGNW